MVLPQSQPRCGAGLCATAAVLGLGTEGVVWARPVGWFVHDATPDPVAGGTARGGAGGRRVVVGLAPRCGGLVETALPTLDAVACICIGGNDSVVDGASPCVG